LSLCILAVSLLLGNCSAWRPTAAQSGSRGRAALRAGDYDAAKEHFESALKSAPESEENQLGLLQVLRETGAYEEAVRRADQYLATRETSAALHLERGRVASARGDYGGAERHLRRSLGLQGGAVRLDALRELALLLETVGNARGAQVLWDELISEYRAGRIQGSQALGNVAVAAWHREYFQDANDIFLDATSEKLAGEISLEALSNFGLLFLEKYDSSHAIGVFRDCLKINKKYPTAFVGIALAKKFESNAEAEGYARAALEVNPSLVPAMALIA